MFISANIVMIRCSVAIEQDLGDEPVKYLRSLSQPQSPSVLLWNLNTKKGNPVSLVASR